MSLDQFEIDLAIRSERYYRDTGQWEKLRNKWHPDSSKTLVEISWVKGPVDKWIEGSKAMLKTGIGALHTMQPVEILIKGNRAVATTTISIQGRMNYKGCQLDLCSWGHQIQRLEKVDGSWKFLRFNLIYLRDSISTPFPGQAVPELDEHAQNVLDNARPCMKHLAWSMALIGEHVPNDLPGYDDESTWKPMVERNSKWLETGQD